MRLDFDGCFSAVVGMEGGYSTDPADPGNWTGGVVGSGVCRGTKYGISAASFPSLDIAGLTLGQAKALYRVRYWRPIGGDALAPEAALVVFDGAVNQGVGTAARILQAACGVGQDGVVGPITIAAAGSAVAGTLVAEIAARRACAYANDNPAFWLGWYRRLMTITSEALLG